jgi:hypothetical protein
MTATCFCSMTMTELRKVEDDIEKKDSSFKG